MASISRDKKNGHSTIQFVGPDMKRRIIRLGKVSQRSAEPVKVKVEQLVTAKITGHAVDDETARWVAGLEPALEEKLVKVGLVPKRQHAELGSVLASYIEGRIDVKSSTRTVYQHTVRCMIEHFGEEQSLQGITAGDAELWRLFLV